LVSLSRVLHPRDDSTKSVGLILELPRLCYATSSSSASARVGCFSAPSCAASARTPLKSFTGSVAHTAGDWGAEPCPIGEIDSQSAVLPGPCQAYFHRMSCLGRSTAHSSRRCPGSQSILIGGDIPFAPIAWPVRLLPAAERPAAGPGGLATSARADCQPHSEHRPDPIANADLRRVQAFVVFAASRFIASGGTLTCGTRHQQECHLALCLHRRLAILECAE
jgi:hypothetical protein